MAGLDPGWRDVRDSLEGLHLEKAGGYGTDEEPFANYINLSEAVGEPDTRRLAVLST